MVRIGSIVLKVSDGGRGADFWGSALGYAPAPGNPLFLVDPHGTGARLHVDEDDRTHLDLWVADEAEQQAEVARLVALGATRVDWTYPDDPDFVVLADPDGNLFCVVNAGPAAGASAA